jgi:hypothetical protein
MLRVNKHIKEYVYHHWIFNQIKQIDKYIRYEILKYLIGQDTIQSFIYYPSFNNEIDILGSYNCNTTYCKLYVEYLNTKYVTNKEFESIPVEFRNIFIISKYMKNTYMKVYLPLINDIVEAENKFLEVNERYELFNHINQKTETDIFHIPVNNLTYETCDKAIDFDPYNIQYVPESLKNLNLCRNAYQYDKMLIVHIPELYRDMLE